MPVCPAPMELILNSYRCFFKDVLFHMKQNGINTKIVANYLLLVPSTKAI